MHHPTDIARPLLHQSWSTGWNVKYSLMEIDLKPTACLLDSYTSGFCCVLFENVFYLMHLPIFNLVYSALANLARWVLEKTEAETPELVGRQSL